MNRRIKKQLDIVQGALEVMYAIIDTIEEEPTEEEPEEVLGENLTSTPEKKIGVYFTEIKELSDLKDVSITGQITNTMELKSYVKKDESGITGSGLIYRVVLSDPSGDITVIAFDKMAEELKKHTIGTHLRITNAWKMKDNKHGVAELHIGNYAKIEVVE